MMNVRPGFDVRARFKAGETIFSEGDPGDRMYYILSGQVQILKNFAGIEREVNLLDTGDFFGEIAILHDGARKATARAKTDVEMAEILRPQFEGLLALDVEIPIRMLRGLSDSLTVAQSRLDQALQMLSSTERQRFDEESSQPMLPVMPPDHLPILGRLQLMGAPDTERWLLRARESRIGRRDRVTGIVPEVDLTEAPNQSSVSRLHARIRFDNQGVWLIEEIGVKNGTHVNGHRLAPGIPYPISSGDHLLLGAVTLVFAAGS